MVKAKSDQSDRHWPVPLKMLLDNELFIPKAWLRFIPNPDMLQKLKFNRRLTFILSICKRRWHRTDTDLYNDVSWMRRYVTSAEWKSTCLLWRADVLVVVWACRWYWASYGWGCPTLSCPCYWSCRSSQCPDRPESDSACSCSLAMSLCFKKNTQWGLHTINFSCVMTSTIFILRCFL